MIQRWPSPIFILLLLLLCNRKRDLVTRREKVTCQRSISFYLFFFFFFLSCSFSTLRVAILYHSKIKVSIMVRGVSLLVCPSYYFAWIFDGYSLKIVRGSTITFDDIYCIERCLSGRTK